jgi:hypothetical protein
MTRSIRWFVTAAALPLLAVGAYSLEAKAQVVVQVGPPSAYIASYEPIYYNGFAHYLWHDHWYYRDHGAWHWWDHEPGFLHDHRGEWAHHWHHWR